VYAQEKSTTQSIETHRAGELLENSFHESRFVAPFSLSLYSFAAPISADAYLASNTGTAGAGILRDQLGEQGKV